MKFMGFERPDGSVGVRNIILVVAGVDCMEGVARRIAEKVPSAVAVTQHYSCLHVGTEQVVNIMSGVAKNPNISAVVLLGMGCESLKPKFYQEQIAESGKPVKSLSCYEEGGVKKTVQKGISIVKEMETKISTLKRRPFDLEKLTIGLKCGGSDTTSGLAANPALGVAVDMLVDNGAAAIFTEPIEAIGGEEALSKRTKTQDVKERLLKVISNEEKRYTTGTEVEFMCKGNILGGLSSIEEKSLGSIHKAGSRKISGVLENSQRIVETPPAGGLYFFDGTHFDVQSIINLVAAGAQIVAYTTGWGASFESLVAPIIRICGNPESYEQMKDDIDINAGTIIQGKESIEEVGQRIFHELIEVASGKPTKLEDLGYGTFAIYREDPAMDRFLGISKIL